MISIHDDHSSDMEVDDLEKQMAVPEHEGGMKVKEMNVTVNKNGGIISGLLMKLLLKQMPPESVKAELENMIGGADNMVKEKIMSKFDEILQMQTIGMEHRMSGDPMLRGEMPEGFDNQPEPRSASSVKPVEQSVDREGRPIDIAGTLN